MDTYGSHEGTVTVDRRFFMQVIVLVKTNKSGVVSVKVVIVGLITVQTMVVGMRTETVSNWLEILVNIRVHMLFRVTVSAPLELVTTETTVLHVSFVFVTTRGGSCIDDTTGVATVM